MEFSMFTSRVLVSFVGACSLVALGSSARAQNIWVETTDAGQSISTVQETKGSKIDAIVGSFGTVSDADLYCVRINGAYDIHTAFNPSTTQDTQLFLFDKYGHGIQANDDFYGLQSHLFGTLPAGEYILGISTFDNDPMDASAHLIFPSYPYNGVYGPNAGVGPLAFFNGNTSVTPGSGYQIHTTGIAGCDVPEPGSIAFAVLSAGSVVGLIARRRKMS